MEGKRKYNKREEERTTKVVATNKIKKITEDPLKNIVLQKMSEKETHMKKDTWKM